MSLLKELHASKSEQLSEASPPPGLEKGFSKMFDTLETNLEKVGAQLKPDSQLAKTIALAGGDTKHFASIVKKYDALFEEVLELIQYTMSSFDPVEEAVSDIGAFQKVIDFAGKAGYTVKANGARNKFVFKNKEFDHTVETSLSSEDGEILVNFYDSDSGTSGNDSAADFLVTFREYYKDIKRQNSKN